MNTLPQSKKTYRVVILQVFYFVGSTGADYAVKRRLCVFMGFYGLLQIHKST